jgi:hypothetical protein
MADAIVRTGLVADALVAGSRAHVEALRIGAIPMQGHGVVPAAYCLQRATPRALYWRIQHASRNRSGRLGRLHPVERKPADCSGICLSALVRD